MDWLEKFLSMDEAIKNTRDGKALPSLLELKPIAFSGYNLLKKFDKKGFVTPVFDNDDVLFGTREHMQEKTELVNVNKTPSERYNDLRNPKRLDTEYVLAHCFKDVVPLYSYESGGKVLKYPAIIAALGKIGEQPFLIIGNQPVYGKIGEKVFRGPASPTPSDYEYAKRMLDFGERLGYPAVFITDTLGADPTLEAEISDQSRKISDMIAKSCNYKPPVISIVIGGLGSGGGLATTPIGDHVAASEQAMFFVAEPESASSILYSKPNPQKEEIIMTTDSMSATSQDQLRLKLIDAIIPEPPGGSQENPVWAAELIRNHIAKVAHELLSQSNRKRLGKRKRKIRKLRGFPIKQG